MSNGKLLEEKIVVITGAGSGPGFSWTRDRRTGVERAGRVACSARLLSEIAGH
ncbi:MAG: hypothetical protein VB949_16530 [Pseudomonadales bacterium]|jgi:NADP-dependent 3-hydroxy acid dehydrogenase YdfG